MKDNVKNESSKIESPKAPGKWRKRVDYWRWLNWEAGYAIRDAIVRKVKKAFQNPFWTFFLLVRIGIVVLIALAIGIWVDPYVNLISYPLNLVVFGFLLLIYLYAHFVLALPVEKRLIKK